MSKNLSGNLLIVLFIAVVVPIIVYLIVVSFKKTENTTDSYDKAAINNALIGAGINTKKENFQDSAIVYDSVDKIKNNFETFITTYFPFLDIKIMNDMLKNDYGVNKTIKEIISEHPDANLNMLIQSFLPQIILYLSSMLDNSTNIILCGLGIILLNKINTPDTTYYYLEDYEKMNDFIIYITPSSYDVNKITSTNTDFKYEDETDIRTIKTFKIGLKRYNRTQFKNMIVQNLNKPANINISDEEIDTVINIFKSNKQYVLKYGRLFLMGPLIRINNGVDLIESSKIVADLSDLCIPEKYFSKDMTPYLPSSESTNLSSIARIFNFLGAGVMLGLSAQQYSPPTTIAIPTISVPTITVQPDTTQPDIIKLYSEENYTGSIKIFDISSANNVNNGSYSSVPGLSVYDYNIDPNPPKSIQFEQPTGTTEYVVVLNFAFSDNTNSKLDIKYPLGSIINPPPFTKTNIDNTKTVVTGRLSNILVYKNNK
jgi:hypothetical protein